MLDKSKIELFKEEKEVDFSYDFRGEARLRGNAFFQKGLINLINSSNKKFQYIFAASFTDYFQHRKPVLTCYLENWEGAEFTSLQLIKSAYNKHYETSRQKQTAIQV